MKYWIFIVAITQVSFVQAAPLQISVEGGALFQTKSDVEIPPGTGTRFSLVDAVGEGPLPYVRLESRYTLKDKHTFRLLLAPLVIEKVGQLDKDVVYDGETFLANTDTTYRYQFNSYRFSYAYRVFQSVAGSFDVGATAKIRHAEIALKQGEIESGYPNLGFVPLLHASGTLTMGEKWLLQMDLDAIGSQYGRAVDFGLFTNYRLNKMWSAGVGYRTVEGGADVDAVYNFAWLHYLGFRVQANL